MKKINSLNDLQTHLGTDIYNSIRDSALQGDPDWLLDMINELTHVTDKHPFCQPFHIACHKLGLTPDDFNIEALTSELYSLS